MNRSLIIGLAVVAASASVFGQASKKPVKIGSVTTVSTSAKSFVGTWVLISAAGKEQGHTKIKLNPNGTFKFIGPSFGSEGTYTVAGETLLLTYLKSDGQALKQPGKGRFNFVEGGKAFIVDRYKYGKHPYVPAP